MTIDGEAVREKKKKEKKIISVHLKLLRVSTSLLSVRFSNVTQSFTIHNRCLFA